jgi:hypothetical protein
VIIRRLVILGLTGTSTVELARDGTDNALNLRQLLLKLLCGSALAIVIDPLCSLLDSGEDGLLVIIIELTAEARLVGELGLEAVNERRKSVERLNTLAIGFVLGGKLFSFTDHALNVILGETTLLVRDGNRLRFTTKTNSQYRSVIRIPGIHSRSLVSSSNLHDTVGVNLKGDLNLRNATRSRRDRGELKLAE